MKLKMIGVLALSFTVSVALPGSSPWRLFNNWLALLNHATRGIRSVITVSAKLESWPAPSISAWGRRSKVG